MDRSPEYFELPDTINDLAPGGAPADADPSTGEIIVPASEASDPPDEVETDLENEERPRTPRWEAQFDPVVDPDADDEVSDSDREADEFFAASHSDADDDTDRDAQHRP